MKRLCLLLIVFLAATVNSCDKEESIKSENCIENDVVVCQESLWKVKYDALPTAIFPYFQFDNKVIVGINKNERYGLSCLEVETGNAIWEVFFDITGEYLLIMDTYINLESNFLIFSIGNWGDTRHIKLDITNGEVIWEIPIEAFNSIQAFDDHYYCTVLSSGDVHPIYKVNIETGQAEHYYETDLSPDADYNAQRSNWAAPFEYNDKEYLFIGIMQMTSPNSANYYYSLMDAGSKERLLTHVPIETVIEKVEIHHGDIYVFTGNGYKIFNMESLNFDKEVQLLPRGEYVYHIFYENKLILGLDYFGIDGVEDNGESHTHFILDANTHQTLHKISNVNVNPASVMDDILYFVSGDSYYAYNINTGRCVLNFEPSGKETSFCTATYKNEQGEKFVILGDVRHTYCYEGI